jgi:hypothetical protein
MDSHLLSQSAFFPTSHLMALAHLTYTLPVFLLLCMQARPGIMYLHGTVIRLPRTLTAHDSSKRLICAHNGSQHLSVKVPLVPQCISIHHVKTVKPRCGLYLVRTIIT